MNLSNVVRLCNKLNKELIKYNSCHNRFYQDIVDRLENESYTVKKSGLFSFKTTMIYPTLKSSCYGYYIEGTTNHLEKEYNRDLKVLSIYNNIITTLEAVREEYVRLKVYRKLNNTKTIKGYNNELNKAIEKIYYKYYTFLDMLEDLKHIK